MRILNQNRMNHNKVFKRISLLFIGSVLSLTVVRAEDVNTSEEASEEITLTPQAEAGMAYFQGGEPFENGGPSCVTCHNVTNDDVIPGGLFAKDLTDVYERLGEGLTGWLGAPPFPAMASSYNSNPLTEEERANLTAFFKYANGIKDSQEANNGYSLFVFGGGIGLVCLLGLIQLLWGKRKRKMVKQDIFLRQKKAVDAKF